VVTAAIPVRMVAPDTGGGLPAGKPGVETSWLDAPFEQWLIETPADLARKAGVGATVAAPSAAERDRGAVAARPCVVRRAAEPALPRQPDGYSSARTRVDAAPGD
jgi:hypothetical protein